MRIRGKIGVSLMTIAVMIVMFKMDTNPKYVNQLIEFIRFTHEDLCDIAVPEDISKDVCHLVKYHEEFMSTYTDDISLKISSYSDVDDFINSRKIEGQTYVSLYINRSLWKFVEYAIKDDEAIEDYWKIKYYCTLKIGQYNTLISEWCKLDEFFMGYKDIVLSICTAVLIAVNVFIMPKDKEE